MYLSQVTESHLLQTRHGFSCVQVLQLEHRRWPSHAATKYEQCSPSQRFWPEGASRAGSFEPDDFLLFPGRPMTIHQTGSENGGW